MQAATLDLHNHAMKLPIAERAELINGLRTSLLAHEHEVESAWLAVANGRLEAYNRGEVKAQPIEKLLAKLKALL
jgi:putative addiction module component (TIGR02574 family)